MNPQPEPDMSEGDQDPRFVTVANEQAKAAVGENNCQNAETIDDLFNRVIGAIHPEVLAAIKAGGADLGEFTMDNMDLESWQIDIPLSPEQSDSQYHQLPQWHEERNPYNEIRYTPTEPNDTSLDDARVAAVVAFARTRQHAQISRGLLSEPQTSPTTPQYIYPPYTQARVPWMQEQLQLQSQPMIDTSQQQVAGRQSMALRPTVPTPEPMQDQSWRLDFTRPTTPQVAIPAFSKAPTQIPRAIAAAPPQSMHFANFAEAQQAATTRVIHHNYHPLANDSSFPQDEAARRFYIRRLYDAFTDITQCIDSATVANFDLRWANLSSGTSPYTPAMITTVCHALLAIAINLHTHGPISLNVYDQGKLENVYKYRDLTFSARIDKVCELMRISKARCGNLLKFEGLEMVVATAPLLIRQTRSNYHHNRNRQDDLVAGKETEAEEMGHDDENED
ncbi:uncharacterized protein J4E92_000823 [Alternaria infectoria]|uniref:uncharacterized protein n=1 Tax=Alternaria infectoria TaxID=45303 RepID=UPI00221EF29F|nr:uncharacterized protein J4E92_000823 [Alternaria infectoria]KAI4939537.1 hypothetical protein J4E92_000823 [Alternaria infectoria]